MTLYDLWMLLKRNWVFVIALPLVCAVACLGVMIVQPPTYSATATLVASSKLSSLSGQAVALATQMGTEGDLDVQTVPNAVTNTVSVTVTSTDPQECVSEANRIAAEARSETLELFGQDPDAPVAKEVPTDAAEAALQALTGEELVSISLTEAVTPQAVSRGIAKYTIVAFLAGLFLAICIVIIRDMARGSIHNAYEVEERYDLRRLGCVGNGRRRSGEPADAQDESLLAALDFAGDGARALCLVPMESVNSAAAVVGTLEAASEKAERTLAALRDAAGLPLTDADSLLQQIAARMQLEADLALVVAPAVAESADYAYLAPACGKAVLVLEAMRSKRTHLEDALRQLALSDTEVAGFVMVNDR